MTFSISNSASSTNDSGTDDLFANSSTETVVENVDFSLIMEEGNAILRNHDILPSMDVDGRLDSQNINALKYQCRLPNSEHSAMEEDSMIMQVASNSADISLVTNEFVSEASNYQHKLFCSFCIEEFAFEFMLKDHIKGFHKSELNKILSQRNNEAVLLHPCLFCHAKFYSKHLLSKHIINNHQNDTINILQNRSTDKYITCRFCSYKVYKKHKKLLIIHIEKKHFVEFESFLESHASNTSICSADNLSVRIPCTPGLSDLFSQVDTSDEDHITHDNVNTNMLPRSILKNTIANKENNSGYANDELNCSREAFPKRSARRGLRFENLDSVSTGLKKENVHTHNTEKPSKHGSNVIGIKKTTKAKWKSILSFKKKHTEGEKQNSKSKVNKFITSTPNEMYSHVKLDKISTYPSSSPTSMHYFDPEHLEQVHTLQSPITSRQLCSPKKKVSFKSDENRLKEEPCTSTNKLYNQEYNSCVATVMQFKCGLCQQAFAANAELLKHKKKCHRGPFNMLHPHYRCGECEAKFYRNSFLIRHCQFHHTPLCLRNNQPS